MFNHTDCKPSGLFLSANTAQSVKLFLSCAADQRSVCLPLSSSVNALYCLNFYDMATVFLSFRRETMFNSYMTEQTDSPLADT